MPMPDRGFQLVILPNRRMDWRTLATSYGLEVLFILILVNVSLFMPDEIKITKNYHITELIPRPALIPEKIRPKPLPVRAKLLPAAPIEKPHLVVTREIRQPKIQAPPEVVEAPKVAMNSFAPAVIKPLAGGARPVLVHTGSFEGSSQVPTVNAPVQKVQTGGFGDPNGLKGEGKPTAHLVAASSGAFDMPMGAGEGNGSGGAKGIKGTIASAGFGNGIASPGNGDGRSSGRGNAGVQTSGFGAQEISHGGGIKTAQLDQGPPTTPVEITFKPNPAYSEEARNLKLEGEVLLEVSFSASGQLHVNRVVRGLGHGLDETAIAAANKMRFKPALRNGQPVDSTAVVHVVFQLAY